MSDEQTLQGEDYSYKSLNAQFNIDEAEGIVEAFAAGLGNKDSVGDICLPGCFAGSLKRRKPRVVWGHNWNEPIGKVLEIYEVGPNDPRLPAKMRKAGIGGLYVRVQFNLKSERGKEAFANVSFFGLEQEWSIGYKTLDAVFDPVQGANLLKEVELYEVSPVLHGANQLTGTISIKADEAETSNKDEVRIKREVLRDPKGGLTAAGRRHFKRTEGANLKPGVKGPADTPEKMRRKGSFLTRFFTNPSGPMKKPNGKPTRLALSAAAWGEPVPQNMEDAAKLAAKGRRLLERYENSKKKKKDDFDSVEAKNHVAAIYEAYNSSQNEVFGRASELTRALAVRFGGPVRLVTADNDIAIFEMGAGQSTEMMRVAYHYDGDEFMFGTAQQVKPETVYIPTNDSMGSRVNPSVPSQQVPIAMNEKPMGGHCCPGCAGGKGDCDATVSLEPGEDFRVAFVKLKSLGEQLGFTVKTIENGFVLGGFGSLSPEAQDFVAKKIEGNKKKALTPIGMLAVNMNPATARDADQDRLVLEGIPTVNLGRGVPDPTPFNLPEMRDPFRDGMIQDSVGFEKPGTARRVARTASRADIPRMMPAVPDPDREAPDVIPEKPKVPVRQPVEKPEREKIKPRTPSRPTREPKPQPQPVEPTREPIKEPVPVVPRREPARQPAGIEYAEPMAAMAGVPENVRSALRDIDMSSSSGVEDEDKNRVRASLDRAVNRLISEQSDADFRTVADRFANDFINVVGQMDLNDDEVEELRRDAEVTLNAMQRTMQNAGDARKVQAMFVNAMDKITPQKIAKARTKREEMRGRLRDLGYQQMRELMGIDDENKPSVDGDPTASMSRTNKDDLGRRIWLERTHDNASLEDVARKYKISRQEARQLEMRHARSLRQMDENSANRVGRRMVDDVAATISDEESDLLRRRFDGELLDESARRLGMDVNAVRRMEQLALAKLRDAMVADEPTSSMGVRRRNQAAGTVRRPKGETSPLTGRRKRQRIDPSVLEMVASLEDTGPSNLTDSQRLRLAMMMRVRRRLSNRIDEMMASGAKRRIADLSDDVRQLDQAHEGPFANTTEAAHMALGTVTDIAGSMVKMANNDHDPLDVDSSVNAMVFNAVDRAGGDVRTAARSLGMSPEVVASRYNSHALRVLGSSTPGREMVRAAINDRGDLLDDTETATVLGWLNGMGDMDVAENIGSSFTPSQVVEKRAAALRKIGVNVGSTEMRRKIVSGRIFYNEHGLYAELVDQNGNIVKNRIGDGPTASMSSDGRTKIVQADFGDGRQEYAIKSSVPRETSGGFLVSLVRLSGDDQNTVSSLIGREILGGDDRNSVPVLNGLLRNSGVVEEIVLNDGRRSTVYRSRMMDGSLVTTPRREILKDASRIKESVVEAQRATVSRNSDMVNVAERRVDGLEQAIRHFDETGDWLGEDFGVSFHIARYLDDFVYETGIDTPDGRRRRNENGEWEGDVEIPQPINVSAEERDEIYAERIRKDKPNATDEEISIGIADRTRQFRDKLERKLDIARKELEMRRFIADTKQTRISQNMIDLEDLPPEVTQMLNMETDHIRRLPDPRVLFIGEKDSDITYSAHKGTHVLDGGVLQPSRSQGVVGGQVSVAGNTALINQRSSQMFIATTKQQRRLFNGATKLRDFLDSGENTLKLDDESSFALKRLLDERLVPTDGLLDLNKIKQSYPNYSFDIWRKKLADYIPPAERTLRRYEKAVAALEKSGGNYLSAEIDIWDAIRGIGGYYARYASADIPENVEVNPPEWRQTNYGERREVVDDYMSQWWHRFATRGGTWLVSGERDSEISEGVVGSTHETQLLSPMKPLVGVSTRWGNASMNEAERDMYARLTPAIFARAVKQHKRDGRVDVDSLLSDPSLAPDGYIYDGPVASMSADPNDADDRRFSTSKGDDLVERSDRFYPIDNNRLIDMSRMPVAEQDEMFELADNVRYGQPMTPEQMVRLEMLVRKAERINAPKVRTRKNPHEFDEVLVDETAAGGDPYKMRWKYVNPTTGEEVVYEMRKVGLDHPAAKMHYVRVEKYKFAPNGERFYAWDHPENSSNEGEYGTVQNWPDTPTRKLGATELSMEQSVGKIFNQRNADIAFQKTRTRALDRALGVEDAYPKPWEIHHRLDTEIGMSRPLSSYKAQYAAKKFYEGGSDTPYDMNVSSGLVETDDSVSYFGLASFDDLNEMVLLSRRTNKPLLVNTYHGAEPGDTLSPDSRYLSVSSPELVFGRIKRSYNYDEPSVFEALDQDSSVQRGSLHLLGTDERGREIAVPVSNIVMNSSPRPSRPITDAADFADASEEPVDAFSVVNADPDTDGIVTLTDGRDGSAKAAAERAQSLSSETGLPHDLVFSYPSSVEGAQGKKELRERRLRDVEVVDGVWDPESGRVVKAGPDDAESTTYVVGTEVITDEDGIVSTGERKTFNASRMKPIAGRRDTRSAREAAPRDTTESGESFFTAAEEPGTETEERRAYPHESLVGTAVAPVKPSDAARALDRNDPAAIEARQRDERNMASRWKMERPGKRTKFPTRRKWSYELDEAGRRVPRYPFRKAWRPWGGAVKSVLDRIRTWREFRDFLNTGTFYMIDWETTGMVAGKARDLGAPLQVAVFKVQNGKIVDEFIRYMNPRGRKLSQWAKDNLKRDGVSLTDELVATFDDPDLVMSQLREFLGDKAILMAHNMEQFDLRVFNQMMPDYEIGGWIDTLAIANSIFEVDRQRIQKLLGDRHPDTFDMVKWVAYPRYGARFWKSYTGPLKRTERFSRRKNKMYFTGTPSTSLEALTNYFGIKVDGAHDAQVDGNNTIVVLGRMIDLAEKWGADPEMFDPEIVDWRDKDESEVHAAAVLEWEALMRQVGGQRETLFDDDGSGPKTPPGGEAPPRPGPSSAKRERETRFDPNRRVLQTLDNGVSVIESRKSGVYFELPDDFSIRVPENAASVLGIMKQGQDGGFGISFVYGTTVGGVPRRQKLFSLEVVPKRGMSPEQARARGLAGYEVHGIDPEDGIQKMFEMEYLNSMDAPDPRVSDMGLPIRHEPSTPGLGMESKKLTSHQYADYVRRMRARSASFDGPTGSMSGLTNRDGTTDPFSYWQYGDNDAAFADMSNEQVAMMAREARRRFENAFYSGPRRNSDAIAHLDVVAAANRTLRARSDDPTDDSGLSVVADQAGYKLSGFVDIPSFMSASNYALPASGPRRRVEMAKNAAMSTMLDSVIASNRRGNAIRALSRLVGMNENEVRARVSSHDFETYRNVLSNERMAELQRRVADGSISLNSMGFVIPENADIQTAARMSNNFGYVASLDDFGPTASMSQGSNYSNMSLRELIAEFNSSVNELFDAGRDGRYDSPEFKIKADSVKRKISDISSEIRRRYFESEEGRAAIAAILEDGPTASMSAEEPDLPMISGSAWLDTRLFEIYGPEQYESVARKIGRRFDDLPSRNWTDPTDDDLVDIYHYAMMKSHDEMVEVAVRSGDFISDAFAPSRASDFDVRGATGLFAELSRTIGVSPSAVAELVERGRETAITRKLAAMDPFSRVEEMNMMRRRNAFRRLLEEKKKELGDAFSEWLATATMRNEDMLTDLNGRPMNSAMVESMGGQYIGFFGETPAEAMRRMAEYYGDDSPDQPTASMGRRNFVPPRYDIKPHEGGWVIIDTANRNVVSSRVFRDRLQALRGAKRMDRGDRTFNPYAPDDPTASMSVTLPTSRYVQNDDVPRFGSKVTRGQVATAVDNYRNGRASLPYPSADYASSHQLMEGWATADASLDTILGRLEYLAQRRQNESGKMEDKAREIESLVNHLYKLQKRRNYFYSQLRDRLSRENPDMADMLESWNSTRSGIDRESPTSGRRGLPNYNLPGGLSSYGYNPSMVGQTEASGPWDTDSDSRSFEAFVSDFLSPRPGSEAAAYSYEANRQFTSIAKVINDQVNVAANEYVKNKQVRPIVKQAVKILGMAHELKFGLPLTLPQMATGVGGGSGGLDLVDSLIDSGALEVMRMGGPRAVTAFLVNAISLGLISMDRAKQVLDATKSDGVGPVNQEDNLNKIQESRLRTNLARVVAAIPMGRRNQKSEGYYETFARSVAETGDELDLQVK